MNPKNPLKTEDGKITPTVPADAQPQGHYWDELRKLKRVKIITHPQSGVILSQKPSVGEEK